MDVIFVNFYLVHATCQTTTAEIASETRPLAAVGRRAGPARIESAGAVALHPKTAPWEPWASPPRPRRVGPEAPPTGTRAMARVGAMFTALMDM